MAGEQHLRVPLLTATQRSTCASIGAARAASTAAASMVFSPMQAVYRLTRGG